MVEKNIVKTTTSKAKAAKSKAKAVTTKAKVAKAKAVTIKPKAAKSKAKAAKSKPKKSKEQNEDIGIVVVDDDITIDQEKVNEERRAYLEESRSQDAYD
jgi:hypothetical protein